jgi:hypothetical protein
VRPDTNGGKSDGDWGVDGRKALVSYRGKEGGDYYYGKSPSASRNERPLITVQIMFLLLTIIMRKFMMPLPRGSYDG